MQKTKCDMCKGTGLMTEICEDEEIETTCPCRFYKGELDEGDFSGASDGDR